MKGILSCFNSSSAISNVFVNFLLIKDIAPDDNCSDLSDSVDTSFSYF